MSEKATQPDRGLSQEEIQAQSAEQVPDREAMTVLSGSVLMPVVDPIEGVISGAIIDQVKTQLPPEVAGIDLSGVASGALGEDTDPFDVLPPELVPDTQVVSEGATIAPEPAPIAPEPAP